VLKNPTNLFVSGEAQVTSLQGKKKNRQEGMQATRQPCGWNLEKDCRNRPRWWLGKGNAHGREKNHAEARGTNCFKRGGPGVIGEREGPQGKDVEQGWRSQV